MNTDKACKSTLLSMAVLAIIALLVPHNFIHAEIEAQDFYVGSIVSNNLQAELAKHTDTKRSKEVELEIAQGSKKLPAMTDTYTKLNEPTLLKAFQIYKSAHNKLASVLYQYNNILKSSRPIMHNIGNKKPDAYDMLEDALLYVKQQLPELSQHAQAVQTQKSMLLDKKLFSGMFERNKETKRRYANLLINYMNTLVGGTVLRAGQEVRIVGNIQTLRDNVDYLTRELAKQRRASQPAQEQRPHELPAGPLTHPQLERPVPAAQRPRPSGQVFSYFPEEVTQERKEFKDMLENFKTHRTFASYEQMIDKYNPQPYKEKNENGQFDKLIGRYRQYIEAIVATDNELFQNDLERFRKTQNEQTRKDIRRRWNPQQINLRGRSEEGLDTPYKDTRERYMRYQEQFDNVAWEKLGVKVQEEERKMREQPARR